MTGPNRHERRHGLEAPPGQKEAPARYKIGQAFRGDIASYVDLSAGVVVFDVREGLEIQPSAVRVPFPSVLQACATLMQALAEVSRAMGEAPDGTD